MGGLLHKAGSEEDEATPQEALRKRLFQPRATTASPAKISTGQHLQSLWKTALRLVYTFQLSIPSVVLFLLFSYMNFLNDFGVLCWLAVFSLVPVFCMDFNSSYRFITAVALQFLCVDMAVAVKERALGCGGFWEWALTAVVLYLGVCVLSFLFGVLCGLGCRTGLAVAFSLMTHEFLLWADVRTTAALIVGNILGVFLMRDAFSLYRSLAKRRWEVWLCGVAVGAGVLARSYQLLADQLAHVCLPDVLVGILMGSGHTYGVLKGREIVALRKLVLPYLLKKGIGFAFGLAVGQLIGWKWVATSETSTWLAVICSVLVACGFPLYDWIVAQRIKQLEREGIPITTFQRYLMDSAAQDNPVSLKLHFWDNAGDSVYRTMQQFFRPAEAVYLLAFSLADAQEDVGGQLECLRRWLFSVKAHSKNPNTVVFVVGTHRDSVSGEFIARLAAKLDEELYTDFCSILAMNGDRGPLYVVENSKPLDPDGLNLRQSIIRLAKTTPFMNELFPIRHLKVLNRIQDTRARLPFIMTTSELLAEVGEEGMTLGDLQRILASLHHTGDVIYRRDDDILAGSVILEPQSLMDVMKAIVCIPSRGVRRLTEAEDWMSLETQGLASLKLIKAVVGFDSHILPCVMRLMEAYDLLIPITADCDQDQADPDGPPCQNESTSSGNHLPGSCIIPSHLPEFSGEDQDFWEPLPEDEEFFFDFGYVAPDPIFHRLLSKCWWSRDTNERVFKTRGRFRYKASSFYTIQLLRVAVSQNTIRVIILHDEHNRCTLQVLQFLRDLLEEIRARDFPNLPYSCGPVCRSCSTDAHLNILKVCGDDKEFPTANMQCEPFMSGGKYHQVHLTPQLKVRCGRVRSSSSTSSVTLSTDNLPSPCEDPVATRSISVTEQSNGNMVFIGGSHARFDIYKPSSLPGEGENHTDEG